VPRASCSLQLEGIDVIEVLEQRVELGDLDTRDAEPAVRTVLSGQATAIPKARDGIVERARTPGERAQRVNATRCRA
jgi:hypothetical protein